MRQDLFEQHCITHLSSIQWINMFDITSVSFSAMVYDDIHVSAFVCLDMFEMFKLLDEPITLWTLQSLHVFQAFSKPTKHCSFPLISDPEITSNRFQMIHIHLYYL